MTGSKFVYVTYIRITPEKLWHALTTPEIIKQYRFGMSVESEWKVGSTWDDLISRLETYQVWIKQPS